jgi:hypothetical protein
MAVMGKGRLEAFSDVIAIIITIMVLEMKVPCRVPVTYLAGASVEADTSQNAVSGPLGGTRRARNPCSSAPKESVSSAVRRQESTPLWVQGD